MKKIALTLAMLLIAMSALASNGLLWRVSGNGAQKPSYILGSCHLAPATFVDSIGGLRRALSEVDAVYGEVTDDALTSPESQQKIMARVMAPADSTLSKLLSPIELAQVDSLLAVYTGQSGLVAQMEMMKPSFITTQLAMLMLMKVCPQMQVEQPFDAAVMAIGEADGKEIGGLETMESQLALLFGDPLSVQAEALMETVKNDAKQQEQAIALTAAYLNQDLDALTAITVDPEYGIDADGLERLIYRRNRAWAEELAELLPAKSTLVVVGSGHLGGEQGVLNLLKERGFIIESVNE